MLSPGQARHALAIDRAFRQDRGKGDRGQSMRLWVGLGNPGAKYAGNRHNIGFMALDRIASDHGFAP